MTKEGRRGTRVWVWATAIVAFNILGLIGAVKSPVAGAPSGMELVGRLPIGPTSFSALVVDAAKRQLIILSPPATSSVSGSIVVRTFDADSLALVRTLTVPDVALPFGSSSNPVPYTWDQASRRLYIGVVKAPGGTTPVDAILTLEGGERVVGAPVAIDPTAFSPGFSIVGIGYSSSARRLYLEAAVVSGSTLTSAGVQVNELDPLTGRPTWPGPYTVPSCEVPVFSGGPAALARPDGQTAVYLGCGTGNFSNLYGYPGLPGVARVDIAGCTPTVCAQTTTLSPVPGSYAFGESLYDAEGGRFIMVSQGVGAPTQAAWVFDVAHNTFLGNISAGNSPITRPALAATGGRLYVPVPNNSLLVGSDRGLKVGQANKYVFPTLDGVVAAMPFNRTVVVVARNIDGSAGSSLYVYRVNAEPYVAPPAPDPDAATADLPESAMTSSVYGGDSKAFGMRVHQIGGFRGVQQNITTTNGFNSGLDVFAAAKQLANSTGSSAGQKSAPFPYNDNDRDVYTSRIGATRLSVQEASTSAVTADADPSTQGDYHATAEDNATWPYVYAHCADFGKPDNDASTDASVKCDRAGGMVTATVSNKTATISTDTTGASFGTGESSATTSLAREEKAGIIVDTVATAKDVTVGPAHFGEITSIAHAVTHGRTGTAKASYTRVFKNVTMPGYSCGDQVDNNVPGWVRECDPRDVANQLGGLLGARFQVELPGDETVGTPRGARASTLRDPWQHQQDVALNNQAETEVQIPALRVIYYNDNAQRSRFMFEWAGTFADANYHIHRLPQPEFDVEDVTAGSALSDASDATGALGSTASALDGAPVFVDPNGYPTPSYLQYAANEARRGLLLGHSLRLLFAGRWAGLLTTSLWGVLLTPVFLAARRRYLLRTIGDTQ